MRSSERLEVVTASPEQTRALGAAIAVVCEPGDVVLLLGELGSGKTTLTKGLVSALGGGESVTSPTFVLCHRYATRPPLAHVDCYRVSPDDDLSDLALDELAEDGFVVVVEWADRSASLASLDALVCELRYLDDAAPADASEAAEARGVVLSFLGAGWQRRADELAAALDRLGLGAPVGERR